MIKRGLICFAFLMLLFSMSFVSAGIGELCEISVNLLNQDPYPAVQGDYVKLVFQIDGVNNPKCGEISFELKEGFPISFDPDIDPKFVVQGGVFQSDYSSYLLSSYDVRVDTDALDGDNDIEVMYSYYVRGELVQETKKFDLNVQDSRVDFEIFVKDYVPETSIMTLQVLNIGENDVEAITLHIPKQDNVNVKGANRNIIGDLDSNEYTTADFEILPENGDMDIEVIYTDSVNVRRTIMKQVRFDSSYFNGRVQDKKSYTGWIIFGVVVLIVGFWIWRRRKKKKHLRRR